MLVSFGYPQKPPVFIFFNPNYLYKMSNFFLLRFVVIDWRNCRITEYVISERNSPSPISSYKSSLSDPDSKGWTSDNINPNPRSPNPNLHRTDKRWDIMSRCDDPILLPWLKYARLKIFRLLCHAHLPKLEPKNSQRSQSFHLLPHRVLLVEHPQTFVKCLKQNRFW